MAVDWIIETHDVLGSTQDVIREMARRGSPEGTVVQALDQTQGHGRHGRSWISRKGNFYLSLILKPAGQARHVGQLGLLTGLAVAETIRKYLEQPDILTLKWPNDVLLHGVKCAGIIIETELTPKNSLSWVGIGVGVNITSAPKGIGECVEKFAARPFGLTSFRTAFLSHLNKYYMQWTQEGFEPIKEKWLEYAHKKGTKVRVRVGPHTHEGAFQDIDDEGSLIITDHGLHKKKITAGEVYLDENG